MSICTACKRKKYWLLNKDTGNCGLKEPIEMTNAETGEPMLVLSDWIKEHGFKNLKCCSK